MTTTARAKETAFDVVDRIGDVGVFRGGPKPRGPADRHGALDVPGGERVSVFVQTGPSWPTPEVLERGRRLLRVEHRNVARAFLFAATRNKYHYVVERVGGVALPALVRKVRKRSGTLPPVTCARIVRDLCVAQSFVDKAIPRERFRSVAGVATIVADTVVSWDGRVVLAPRVFGTPADAPPWIMRNTVTQAMAALLLALLAPDIDAADVDGAVLRLLVEGAPLRSGVDALDVLTNHVLAPPATPARRRRSTPPPAPGSLAPGNVTVDGIAAALDAIIGDLGGDDESFAAALMAEIFGDRKRADLAWREEMTAVSIK